MNAPKPDRSNTSPNLVKTAENPVLDLGWNEGFLSDSRPYRVEAWAEDQVSAVTFFLSTAGIENHSNAQFADLLEREQLIGIRNSGREFQSGCGTCVACWRAGVLVFASRTSGRWRRRDLARRRAVARHVRRVGRPLGT